MFKGMILLRKFLEEQDDGNHVDFLLECGLIRMLVQNCRKGDSAIAAESLYCLVFVSFLSNQFQTAFVVESGIMEALPYFLYSHDLYFIEKALWVIGNVVEEEKGHARNLITGTTLNQLENIFERGRAQLNSLIVWIVCNA